MPSVPFPVEPRLRPVFLGIQRIRQAVHPNRPDTTLHSFPEGSPQCFPRHDTGWGNSWLPGVVGSLAGRHPKIAPDSRLPVHSFDFLRAVGLARPEPTGASRVFAESLPQVRWSEFWVFREVCGRRLGTDAGADVNALLCCGLVDSRTRKPAPLLQAPRKIPSSPDRNLVQQQAFPNRKGATVTSRSRWLPVPGEVLRFPLA